MSGFWANIHGGKKRRKRMAEQRPIVAQVGRDHLNELSPQVDFGFGQRLVKMRELAARVGLPLATVKHLAMEGKIPGLKLGGQWRFNASAVETQLSAMAATSFGFANSSAMEDDL
jgi:excisionase family DNA binding protein